MANSIDLKKLCFFVCTGASRGIGQKMAIECSRQFRSGSVVILFARSLSGLEETKKEILASNSDLHVFIHSVDLVKPQSEVFRSLIMDDLAQVDIAKMELCFFLHNVGTLGAVEEKAVESNNPKEWHDYLDLNLITVIVLNSELMAITEGNKNTKLIVNITSKAAIAPFKNMGYYCVGKAAREMYFSVFAEEQANSNVIVLNYSPGPVVTDMNAEIINRSGDQETRDMFISMNENKTMLTTAQTTAQFLKVIGQGKFKSGAHVDYYDS